MINLSFPNQKLNLLQNHNKNQFLTQKENKIKKNPTNQEHESKLTWSETHNEIHTKIKHEQF